MYLRHNLKAGGSEGGSRKEVHSLPGITQDADAKVSSRLEGGQEMQGEKSGGGYRGISVKGSVDRGME